jgi:hypothetical protein
MCLEVHPGEVMEESLPEMLLEKGILKVILMVLPAKVILR